MGCQVRLDRLVCDCLWCHSGSSAETINNKRDMVMIRRVFRTLRDRWTAKTPRIFSWIIRFAVGVSTTAVAIQTAINTVGAEAPEWWTVSLPYLVGAGAGAATVAKLTQKYDKNNRPIRKTKTKKNHSNG